MAGTKQDLFLKSKNYIENLYQKSIKLSKYKMDDLQKNYFIEEQEILKFILDTIVVKEVHEHDT